MGLYFYWYVVRRPSSLQALCVHLSQFLFPKTSAINSLNHLSQKVAFQKSWVWNLPFPKTFHYPLILSNFQNVSLIVERHSKAHLPGSQFSFVCILGQNLLTRSLRNHSFEWPCQKHIKNYPLPKMRPKPRPVLG